MTSDRDVRVLLLDTILLPAPIRTIDEVTSQTRAIMLVGSYLAHQILLHCEHTPNEYQRQDIVAMSELIDKMLVWNADISADDFNVALTLHNSTIQVWIEVDPA